MRASVTSVVMALLLSIGVVAQQGGALRVIKNDALLAQPFLTLNVNSSGERGLLGVAFDPNFASNGFVYVYYTTSTSPVHNRLSRFTASAANPDVVAAGSEVQLLNLPTLSSATNHNGGAIHFGTDGKLYIAVGENANGSNAQSLSTTLGKLLSDLVRAGVVFRRARLLALVDQRLDLGVEHLALDLAKDVEDRVESLDKREHRLPVSGSDSALGERDVGLADKGMKSGERFGRIQIVVERILELPARALDEFSQRCVRARLGLELEEPLAKVAQTRHRALGSTQALESEVELLVMGRRK